MDGQTELAIEQRADAEAFVEAYSEDSMDAEENQDRMKQTKQENE